MYLKKKKEEEEITQKYEGGKKERKTGTVETTDTRTSITTTLETKVSTKNTDVVTYCIPDKRKENDEDKIDTTNESMNG